MDTTPRGSSFAGGLLTGNQARGSAYPLSRRLLKILSSLKQFSLKKKGRKNSANSSGDAWITSQIVSGFALGRAVSWLKAWSHTAWV